MSSRLAPAALLASLADRLAGAGNARTALLVVGLGPSDRVLATECDEVARTLLGEVASRVEAVLRENDRYAFASREELWILLVDLPSASLAELAARTLSERLRWPIAAPRPAPADPAVRLDPVIGGAWAPGGSGIDARSMLLSACEAASGRHGRPDDAVRLRELQPRTDDAPPPDALERSLADALAGNELEVHFQPQVDLRTGRCRSAEALIRWPRRTRGPVSPAEIVAISERRGLIGQLTRFTLNAALRHLSDWPVPEVSVAVNLSAATVCDPSLPLAVSQALDTWGVAAERLTLELTESALILNQQVAAETLKRCRELGCRLSIDDFGTGYSPYTYLRQFPFDELKIDQSFVKRMHFDAADLGIVRSLVDLAHTFGMHAVAEGVESESAQRALRKMGCDFAQGWHLSAALPADEFVAWCHARNAGRTPSLPASRAAQPAA